MRKIEAYIQPFMLQKVTAALHAIHIQGMSVIEARGFGGEKDESLPHHSAEDIVDFTPKTKVELFCNSESCDQIVETIQKSAHTGRKGDGKIFISMISRAVSIRTGQTDNHDD